MTIRLLFLLCAVTIGSASDAFAQTPSVPAPAPTAKAQSTPAGSGQGAKAAPRAPARQVTRQETLAWRQACRDEVHAKGLIQRGPARRQAMQDCLRRRPEILRRIECRRQSRLQELEGPQQRSFLRRCYRG